MQIKNNLLYYADGTQVPFRQSPNISKGTNKQKYCVIHYTGSLSASSAIGWMLDKNSKVSAHLHVDRQGNVVQLARFDHIAWHAGASEWDGLEGLNKYSLGIEISNVAGKEYTKEQIDTVIAIGKAFNEAYRGIEYVGHEDIATPKGRKADPGKLFPWDRFREGMSDKNISVSKTTTSDLNLRESAVNGKVITVLPKGTEVNVIDWGSEWSRVFVCSNKLTGFVSNKYLR